MATKYFLQMKAARCMGRCDYRRALDYYEQIKKIEKNPHNILMKALCYEHAGDHRSAIAGAEEALILDPECFEALELLARVHFKRKEYKETKEYVQRALQNYPEPIPVPPRFFFWILRVLSIVPAIRRLEEQARDDLTDPNKDTEEWYKWAREYLKWYGEEYGDGADPTVH